MQGRMQALGGAHPESQRRQPCRPMWQGGSANSGGGGADPSIGPRALETLGTPLVQIQNSIIYIDHARSLIMFFNSVSQSF